MPPIHELHLIDDIKKMFPHGTEGLTLGIGDGCAAFVPSKGMEVLVTTDTLCEHVHFRQDWTTPVMLGGKLASVNLSDIASMGGRAKYALLSLNIPKATRRQWITAFLAGFKKALDEAECALIGGNVSTSHSDLSFTATVIGEVKPALRIDRSGARPGDSIYITGAPGDSALGLKILSSGRKPSTAGERYLVKRHKYPTARLAWGAALADKKLVSATIDISDGVALDLARMLEASGAGATIRLDYFPLSPAAKKLVAKDAALWRTILSGGEDYELMFTVTPGKIATVERMIAHGSLVAAKIGEIVEGKPTLNIIDLFGRPLELDEKGYIHGQ